MQDFVQPILKTKYSEHILHLVPQFLHGYYPKLLKEYKNICPWLNQITIENRVNLFDKKRASAFVAASITASVLVDNSVTASVSTENSVTASVPTDYPVTASAPTAYHVSYSNVVS